MENGVRTTFLRDFETNPAQIRTIGVKALSNVAIEEVEKMDDIGILDLYFARDEQAIRETDSRFGRRCREIAYHILRNHEDAEEVVSDTYTGVWNAIPPARPDSLLAFVSRIARNQALKRLEHQTRLKRDPGVQVSLDELAEVLPDERWNPAETEQDVAQLISDFLRNERPEVRNVFLRKYYFFDSTREIAQRYGFTESKVKNMLFRTRDKLRKYLRQEGVSL